VAFNAPCTRERSASSNTMTLFTESELYNETHPSDRASIAFEKIFHSVRPSRNFASSKQRWREIFFFLKRDSGFVSVSATRRSELQPKGSKLFSLLGIPATPDREFYSNLRAKSLLYSLSRSVLPRFFFSRVTPSRSTGSFERWDKVTSSNYER